MKAALSRKGPVKVPKESRKKLGLKSARELVLEAVRGVLVGRKVQHEDVFHKWRGKGRLPVEGTVDDYLDRIRR